MKLRSILDGLLLTALVMSLKYGDDFVYYGIVAVIALVLYLIRNWWPTKYYYETRVAICIAITIVIVTGVRLITIQKENHNVPKQGVVVEQRIYQH